MCTGVEIAALVASAAATAGGAYMQNEAANDAADAQRKAAQSEMMRQAAIDEERDRTFQQALQGAEPETQQESLADIIAAREAALSENQNVRAEGDASFQQSAASEGSPNVRVLGQQLARDRESGDEFTSQQAEARARLGALGPLMFGFNQNLTDAAFSNQELQRQAANSAQLGQMEAQLKGAEAGQGKALAGNVLTGLGQVGMTGATSGQFGQLFQGANAAGQAANAGGVGGRYTGIF